MSALSLKDGCRARDLIRTAKEMTAQAYEMLLKSDDPQDEDACDELFEAVGILQTVDHNMADYPLKKKGRRT